MNTLFSGIVVAIMLIGVYCIWRYYQRLQRIAECKHDLEYEHIPLGHHDWRTRVTCKHGCGHEELIS